MRRTDSTSLVKVLGLAALLVPLAACGGLKTFEGAGSLALEVSAPVEAGASWAALYHPDGTPLLGPDGHPRWHRLDAEGRVRFDGVPAGEWEVLLATGAGRAARHPVRVYGRREVHERVAPGAAATLAGSVSLADPTASGETVVGVTHLPPVRGLATPEGQFELRGLPPGCYQVFADRRGHYRSRSGACVEGGDAAQVDLHLVPDDVPLCEPCEGHETCGEGGRCVLLEHEGIEERVCTRACASDLECPEGFACETWEQHEGGLCVPHDLTCAALRAYDDALSCTLDAECGLGELDEYARCVGGRCTLSCSDDAECLGGVCREEEEEAGVCLR